MTETDLLRKLEELRNLPHETEWVEFKEAKTSFKTGDLGKYFSALANEAHLKRRPCGWLIFGVGNRRPRAVVGTEYRRDPGKLDSLKHQIAEQTTGRLTFNDIHEVRAANGMRVLMFEIPAAPGGMPIAWQGHFYGRDGESIGPLNLDEQDRIRGRIEEDWSAAVCEGATLDDLDPEAVAFARGEYAVKNPRHAADVPGWDARTFLNKAKVCRDGRVTRTALLLLGKPEAAHRLAPAPAQITWTLAGSCGVRHDYEHFGPPFLLAVGRAFARVRNQTLRLLPGRGTSLFPAEVDKYDAWVVREALHNCIAHQDYTLGGRINLVEEPDALLFTNVGRFLFESVEEVIARDAPPETYRNPFLVQAMVNLNLIDTIGSGIPRMFRTQRDRLLPMPDYDLTDPRRVRVRVHGKILDERFSALLTARTDLSLADVVLLDRVQKRKPLSAPGAADLRRRGLVEGNRPNLTISAKVAAATGREADFLGERDLGREHYRKLIRLFLGEFGPNPLARIEDALADRLPSGLTPEQKRAKVQNLLQGMKADGLVESVGRTRGARWRLANEPPGPAETEAE